MNFAIGIACGVMLAVFVLVLLIQQRERTIETLLDFDRPGEDVELSRFN